TLRARRARGAGTPVRGDRSPACPLPAARAPAPDSDRESAGNDVLGALSWRCLPDGLDADGLQRRIALMSGCGNELFCLFALPQRVDIVVEYEAALHGVPGQWIRTASFRECFLLHAPAMNDTRKTEVSLDAARLIVKPVFGVALLGEILLGGP